MVARALQRLAQRLAAAEACRGGVQLPACSALLQRSLPSLLGDWLRPRPFSAQASELESSSSNGEVRTLAQTACITFYLQITR